MNFTIVSSLYFFWFEPCECVSFFVLVVWFVLLCILFYLFFFREREERRSSGGSSKLYFCLLLIFHRCESHKCQYLWLVLTECMWLSPFVWLNFVLHAVLWCFGYYSCVYLIRHYSCNSFISFLFKFYLVTTVQQFS